MTRFIELWHDLFRHVNHMYIALAYIYIHVYIDVHEHCVDP